MKERIKNIIESIVRAVESSHPVIVLLAISVLGLIIFTGHRYYKFTKEDPHFCELCHVMKEPYKAWQESAHRNTVCQECHSMSLLSQNKLLLSYVFAGNRSNIQQKHGRVTPWDSCNSCHLETAKQGAITPRKSYGHARHVFVEKIACKNCHTADMHNFKPDERNCLKCHKDKGVHGMGMESFACLSCHVYGEVTAMPKKSRCLKCHTEIPTKGPMSTLECQNCHKPHGRIKPTANECLKNCHTNQEAIGRHDRHMKVSCLECHRAHTWRVGKKLASELCVRCHEYRDPFSFIF